LLAVGRIDMAGLPIETGERFQRLASLLDELIAGGAYRVIEGRFL
jgi:hypothetical protein